METDNILGREILLLYFFCLILIIFGLNPNPPVCAVTHDDTGHSEHDDEARPGQDLILPPLTTVAPNTFFLVFT